MSSLEPSLDVQVAALRSFNRFYTQRCGILEPYLGSHLSLTEVRILYELAHSGSTVATTLCETLGLDKAYLSRILKDFEKNGWVRKRVDPRDARQNLLELSEEGQEAYQPLQDLARKHAAAILAPLTSEGRKEVSQAINTIQRLLTPPDQVAPVPPQPITIRNLQPGDLGWATQMHGELYAKEYNFNIEFESLVAEIVGEFGRAILEDPEWNRVWIAEIGGERMGCIFVRKVEEGTAKLRLFAVCEETRGRGVGKMLMDRSLGFCKDKGYTKVRLWTHSCLVEARGIYSKRGFRLVEEGTHDAFGHKGLAWENWELEL